MVRRYLVPAVALCLVGLAAACSGGTSQPTKTPVPSTPRDPNAQDLLALSAK